MNSKGWSRICRVMAFLIFVLCAGPAGAYQGGGDGTGGQIIPPFPLQAPESPEDRQYLGVTADGPFLLSDISAKFVLVEFINVL